MKMLFRHGLALLLVVLTPLQAMAQSTGAASDPLTQEMLRALQQRGGGGAAAMSDTQLQPTIQVQMPPTYPGQQPAVPLDPLRGMVQAAPTTGLSSLEKLMSLRVGQRVLQYGYDLFGRGTPVVVRQSGALQDNYVLGEGDEIVASLTGQEAASYRTRVTRDGRVMFPNMPPIAAAGRAFGDFRADVERAVHHAFVGTQVALSVGAVRQISVRVLGEVNAPGAVSLTGLSTAMDALNLAGGVKKSGSLRDIRILRAGRSFRLDVYGLLTGRGESGDITLSDGDRIVVPLLARTIAVVGQVKRPAIYELGEGAGRVRDLLALAGGTQFPGAYRFSLLTMGPDGRRAMTPVTLESGSAVHDGDALFVTGGGDATLARVELMGAVATPGTMALSGTPTLHALFTQQGVLAPRPGQPLPYPLMGGIIRLDPETLQRAIVPFSPADAVAGRNDRPLQTNDIVYMLNVAEMRYIARRASRTADRDAERNGLEPPREPVTAQDRTDAGLLPLQTGTRGIEGQGQLGTVTPQTPGLTTTPARSQTAETLPFNDQGQTARNHDSGPFGIPDNDALPRLDGIAAPRDARLYPEDRDDNTDRRMPMRQTDPDSTRPQTDRSNQALPLETSATDEPGRPTRPVLRLFVGLDDDERELLVRALGNYYVTVSGEVNVPGAYLAMPDVGLDRLVRAAGDLTPNADLNGFEVSSAIVDNAAGVSRTERKTYRLTADRLGGVTLKPLDAVRFSRIFSDHAGSVQLFGEIRSPGQYEITRSEKLSSVLARAGGLTQAAYPYGAVFLRKSVAEQERAVLRREADALDSELIALMGNATATKGQVSDAEIQYVNQMMIRLRQADGPGGRMAVKLDAQEIAAHPELDITVEPGDRLYIPRLPSSVVVSGEVMSPSGIQFQPGLDANAYVARAGGTTEVADDDHIFIIQPDGSAVQADSGWLGQKPTLAPGSVVIVPRTLRPFTWDVLLQNAIQVTSQLALTAASISVIGH